jgi:hypothetical protein
MIELLAMYGVYLFGTSLLIWRYGRNDRGPSIVVAAVAPVLLIAALAKMLALTLVGRLPRIEPCPQGLSDAEVLVERRRLEMFGGKAVEPHFASDWARLYEKAVEEEAERVQLFAKRVLSPA